MLNRIAFLATGNEIIEGKTLNTNAKQLASILFSEGCSLGLQMTCSDEKEQIIACLKTLSKNHSWIIVTGGLGPTSDDNTRFAVADFLKLPLITYEDAICHIQKRKGQTQLSRGDKQQALFPETALRFANPHGTAMGGWVNKNKLNIVMLPGPPRECIPMFETHLLSLIKPTQQADIIHYSWLAFGRREEEIARLIDEALEDETEYETGYRLDPPYVECKVRCKKNRAKLIEEKVAAIVEPHILISPETKASQALIHYLEKTQTTIRIEDKATGGLLQHTISQPQTFHLLQFSSQNPEFICSGLDAYWKQDEKQANEIHIRKCAENLAKSKGVFLPFKSPLVINMAVEWLCAQLFFSLNGGHKCKT